MHEQLTLQQLFDDLPQQGSVEWIGVRADSKQPMLEPSMIEVNTDVGIVGDRYAGRSGKRHVTLIQAEHIVAMASMLGVGSIQPAELRRNLSVAGINLLALKDKRFKVGDVVLEYTGLCHPCSAMQKTFGAGGYNAVRGHGGINVRVLQSGTIRLGDKVVALSA